MKLIYKKILCHFLVFILIVKLSKGEDVNKENNKIENNKKEDKISSKVIKDSGFKFKETEKSTKNEKGVVYEKPVIRPRIEQAVVLNSPPPVVTPMTPIFSNMETPIFHSVNIDTRPSLPVTPKGIPTPITPPYYKRNNPIMSIESSPYAVQAQLQKNFLPPGQFTLNTSFMNHPPAFPIGINQQPLTSTCGCAQFVKCPPCGIVAPPQIMCPCAPKPICKQCPPISVIHEMASKRAIQDQKLSNDLQSLSNKMTAIFKNISKFAGDVVKFELEAKEASLKMEEAALKANFSRHQMEKMSEKARLIAKNTINGPCVVNCSEVPGTPGELLGLEPNTVLGNYIDDNRVFPQEVENIGDFMKETYSTNINGYNARENDYYNKLENDAEGGITVEPLGEETSEMNKSVESNKKSDKSKKKSLRS